MISFRNMMMMPAETTISAEPSDDMHGDDEVSVRVHLARIEQRLDDHEAHDEHFRKAATWFSGIVLTGLLAALGTMWSDITRVEGRQQVVLSTIVEIRGQLTEIKDGQKALSEQLRQHAGPTNLQLRHRE